MQLLNPAILHWLKVKSPIHKTTTLYLITSSEKKHSSIRNKKTKTLPFYLFTLSLTIFILITEAYDKESAAAHVRRLLDIVACTTSFGPSAGSKEGNKTEEVKNARGAQDKSSSAKKSGSKSNNGKQSPATTEDSAGKCSNATILSPSKDDISMMIDGEGETNNSCPKLGSFYEFFSLAHLSPPLQCIASFSLSSVNFVIMCVVLGSA